MKIYMFAASMRADSLNKKLINLVEKITTEMGHTVDKAQFNEFDTPMYNADDQNNIGMPPQVTRFVERLKNADAVIISSPEYNYSTPGNLKNLIDWVSRVTPMPLRRSHIKLLSASPSLGGGNRGLWCTRIPLEACGALVHPDMFSLASAHEAFDAAGNLKNEQLQQLLTNMLTEFLAITQKLKASSEQ